MSRILYVHSRKASFDCLLELSEWHAAFVQAREPVPA